MYSRITTDKGLRLILVTVEVWMITTGFTLNTGHRTGFKNLQQIEFPLKPLNIGGLNVYRR
jgi:hypothetical protein